MRKTLLFLLCSFGLISASYSQNEARHWYFGQKAGLEFMPGSPPAADTTGMINTREGCSSISDSLTGALLFYTDGQTVYNAQHQVMTNGTGLLGNPSSTQAALIVPHPGSPGVYYLFTSDIPSSGNGISFSEVHLATNSVDSVTKNTPLLPGNTISERLAATYNANGGYWVMTHDLADNFYAFAVTPFGVNPSPVISTAGSSHNSQYGGIGYLKFSPSGTRAAVATSGSLLRVEAFDFNTATGQVSAPIAVIDNISAAYGVEFSPDERYLYVTGLQRSGSVFSGSGQIAQYDLQAGSLASINQSRYVLATSATESYGALQLAPNGQIIVSKETSGFGALPSLDVIEKPNSGGIQCDFNANSLLLDTGVLPHRTRIGLPNFVSTVFKPLQVTGVVKEVAENRFGVLIQNPAIGYLHYQLQGSLISNSNVALYDVTGRLTLSCPLKTVGVIDVSALVKGIYIAVFSNGIQTVRQRVVID